MLFKFPLIISLIGLFSLVGCEATPRAKVSQENTAIGEITRMAAYNYYSCVARGAHEMRSGSSDVRLVVDTAVNACNEQRNKLYDALVLEQINPSFAEGYASSILNAARNFATQIVLKGNARAAVKEYSPP